MTSGRGPHGYGRPGATTSSSTSTSPGTGAFPGPDTSPAGGGAPSGYSEWSSGDLVLGRPPVLPLAAALAAALLGCVGALVLGVDPVAAWVSWALAGPVAIVLAAWFARRDTVARAGAAYSAPGWLPPLLVVTGVLVVVGIGLGAWRLAEWAGRL